MGCVAAANWWIKRFPHWKKLRKRFYYPNGNDSNGKFWEHEVVTDGNIEIDISPYANRGTLDK